MPVTSMRGQKVDMALLAANNSQKVALGNAGMNARGDRVAKNGTVIESRETTMLDYNGSNPKAVRQVGLNDIRNEIMSPSEAVAKARRENAPKRKISE